MRLAPKFTHDCLACTFLGRLDGQDAYACTDSTLILRDGNDGPEYRSMDMDLLQVLPSNNVFHTVKRMLGD